MVRPHIRSRTLAALIVLAVMAAVFVALGNWQLRRAAERTALRASIEAGRAAAPLVLDAATPPAALQPWRPASVRGTWRPELTVLLENRNHEGRPGYWVATPLLLHAHESTAVLVLRGWLPRFGGPGPVGQAGQPSVQQPQEASAAQRPAARSNAFGAEADALRADAIAPGSGEHTIQGELLARVPRLFELASWAGGGAGLPVRLPRDNGTLPVLQNLDLADYQAATGLKLLPAVLAQTAPQDSAASSTNQPVLVRDWPQPSLDADQNRGYALQWFGFAAIAAGAWLTIAWRALRRARKP
ncbi:SURF1 family protein [Pusillimonas sp. TS35]|uniref:SURF1 family protein n=1 Tax=Paracandidimonas lactea TaxID=2895524 RepID=UPI00136978A4|nr:SURF1 family protein [Paracandidimonas lactea]MYN12740.1 SURF1 family protein [Pusillimonas sp. TS35]